MSAADVVRDLAARADPERAKTSVRFFKCGPGEYGEGDVFVGVTVPLQRAVAKARRGEDLASLTELLESPVHEHRLTALLILVEQHRRGDEPARRAIVDLYLSRTHRINNWDLVDSSAPYILGPHLAADGGDALLARLARSTMLWERRIAMIACQHEIRAGRSARALRVATWLQRDEHDLIHKAVGWMMREVGERCGVAVLEGWLREEDRYKTIPRTMLRYAIEHFSPARRKAWLEGRA